MDLLPVLLLYVCMYYVAMGVAMGALLQIQNKIHTSAAEAEAPAAALAATPAAALAAAPAKNSCTAMRI